MRRNKLRNGGGTGGAVRAPNAAQERFFPIVTRDAKKGGERKGTHQARGEIRGVAVLDSTCLIDKDRRQLQLEHEGRVRKGGGVKNKVRPETATSNQGGENGGKEGTTKKGDQLTEKVAPWTDDREGGGKIGPQEETRPWSKSPKSQKKKQGVHRKEDSPPGKCLRKGARQENTKGNKRVFTLGPKGKGKKELEGIRCKDSYKGGGKIKTNKQKKQETRPPTKNVYIHHFWGEKKKRVVISRGING